MIRSKSFRLTTCIKRRLPSPSGRGAGGEGIFVTMRRVAAAFLVAIVSSAATAQTEQPAWKTPTVEQIGEQLVGWLDETQADEATRTRVTTFWQSVPEETESGELLSRLADAFALVDQRADALVQLCSRPKTEFLLPDQSWLTGEQTPALLSNNLRLFYARWLAQEELFDEALEQIRDLKPADVVAPSTLLFYQSVAHHWLLDREASQQAIGKLLQDKEASPVRYVALARLMQQDIEGLQEDSLDHIARRMGDIQRRLDLGRAGKRVQNVEDGVIKSLDKLIKKLEDQAAAAAAAAAQSNNIQSKSPAQDSTPMGGRGPGNVAKRNIGSDSGWGNLPEKQREEALQDIGREFPSHYREVIEQYFRRLAAEENR